MPLSFIHYMCEEAQRYLREAKGKDVPLNELLALPHWQKVWYFWKAKEHFEGYVPGMTAEECKTIYGN